MEKIIHDVDFLVKAGPYSHIVEARGFCLSPAWFLQTRKGN
jgi:hypothetical protein